jgi:hypothetical protein
MRSKSRYPEHDKLQEVAAKSQVCAEFIEWLGYEKGIVLAKWIRGEHLVQPGDPIDKLLAEFFEIDLAKIEREKRAMLSDARARST